jgi:hypothetical protein
MGNKDKTTQVQRYMEVKIFPNVNLDYQKSGLHLEMNKSLNYSHIVI